jgi:flagellar biosynthesis/type III secretory pathway chaperone
VRTMTTTTELATDVLAALVATKLKIVELLAQLARRQLVLARDGDMSDLLKLLAAKQTVLGQLQIVEQRLDPFRSQNPDERVWASSADRARCQQQASRCDELLAETMQLERQGESEMVRRRDSASTALNHFSAAADAQVAYLGPLPTAGPSLQLRCEG